MTGGSAVSNPMGSRAVQSPLGHSFASKQPTYPSPANFSGQALQVRDPGVLAHCANRLHPPL
jgi:hypothetical protein